MSRPSYRCPTCRRDLESRDQYENHTRQCGLRKRVGDPGLEEARQRLISEGESMSVKRALSPSTPQVVHTTAQSVHVH